MNKWLDGSKGRKEEMQWQDLQNHFEKILNDELEN
jgi:hypothetical protein